MSFFLDPTDGGIDPSEKADASTPKLNVGCLFDHFSGRYTRGAHGESLLNGGMSHITAVVGKNNQYKSTTADYFMAAAQNNYYDVANSFYKETEGSRDLEGLEFRMEQFSRIQQEGVLGNPKLFLTNMNKMSAEGYWEKRKQYGKAKAEAKGSMLETPFLNPDGSFIKVLAPTVEEIDSWSMLSFEALEKKAAKTKDVADSKNNMLFANDGMYKTRIIMAMPGVNGRTGFYTIMTAHLGDSFNMDPNSPPEKIMSYMQAGTKIKNATEKFTYIPNNMWMCHSQKPHLDKEGIPIYGRGEKGEQYDKDLIEVKMINLRGKFGQSGAPFKVLYSQTEGLLPHLTQLNYIREANSYFGMGAGNQVNMALDFYPDGKFTRNSLRNKIKEDYMLRRALELTSGLAQIKNVMWYLGDLAHITPPDVFRILKEKGYDWDELLGGTRGHWQYNDVKEEKQFLSSLDLLRMAVGEYHPYWMPQLKK